MGDIVNGTAEDHARENVLIEFNFEPMGTKKSLDTIFAQRNITDPDLRALCLQEAEGMVADRYLRFDDEGVWVFSQDRQEQYSWEPASIIDRVINDITVYLTNRQLYR